MNASLNGHENGQIFWGKLLWNVFSLKTIVKPHNEPNLKIDLNCDVADRVDDYNSEKIKLIRII